MQLELKGIKQWQYLTQSVYDLLPNKSFPQMRGDKILKEMASGNNQRMILISFFILKY